MVALSQGLPTPDEQPATRCATLAAEYDWSTSEFGPRKSWDPAVSAVVRTVLDAASPMAYCHGPGYSIAYNDRFADLLGTRHPRSWAQRAAMAMPELWSQPGYAEAVDNVFTGGQPFHDEGEMLDLRGWQEKHPNWAYLARGYSAVRDDDGAILGILIVVVEIAPVLVLVGGSPQDEPGAARWRGIELWDETVSRGPLIWSGFRAGARPPESAVAEPDQRFVAEGEGELILPINGPDIAGSIGYRGMKRHLPDVQMVTLAARDENDTDGARTAGEFYDVFGMPDGRLALTIGDVLGAGVATAAVMRQIKVGLRGAALTSSEPNTIFTALDDLVGHLDQTWPAQASEDAGSTADGPAGFGGELFATALLGVFDPVTGKLTLASAGHLPPAIVHRPGAKGGPAEPEGHAPSGEYFEPNGHTQLGQHAPSGEHFEPNAHTQLGEHGPSGEHPEPNEPTEAGRVVEYAELETGPPLGITGDRPTLQLVLDEGDALVGFTSGLLKRNERTLVEGMALLSRTLGTMSSTAPRSISQHVVDELIAVEGLEHDCALLVVVRDSRAHQRASVLVPPHAIAVRGARRWAQDQLESWGLDAEVVTDTVMCVSELVTNVGQHAGTSARVTMELADRLLVTVEDTGTWSTPRTGRENHSASQGRGLALVAATSDAMGHARGADGSTVWFEIVLDRRHS